ncbi:MAG: creatininase family protein [Afipia sp.]|nr:creatininase family protein [Afipia sp.]
MFDRNPNAVEHLTWDEVGARIAGSAAAILPVGAGAKQHGFHLPMNTDRVQAEAIALRLADRFDALMWPTLTYGYYPAFTEYAGSASLSDKTFEGMVEELTRSMLGYGCRAVFILDTGLSTIAPIARALSRVGSAKALHLKIRDGSRYRAEAKRLARQSHGSHADELETSLMLMLAPHLVDMKRAEASPPIARETEGALRPSDPSSANYSRSGVFGDPTLATRAKGEVLLSAVMDDLFEQAAHFLGAHGAGNNRIAKS